jgi:hypothetical protein
MAVVLLGAASAAPTPTPATQEFLMGTFGKRDIIGVQLLSRDRSRDS